MHGHGTAVLDKPTGATPPAPGDKSARQRWLDKCEADLAEALATKNVYLLPLIAEVLFADLPDPCPDCQGTGYTQDGNFNFCYCMTGDVPAYDLPRYKRGEIIGSAIRLAGRTEVWMPCPECEIGPAKTGPYLWNRLIEAPWVPDCHKCNDTGWSFSHTRPADHFMARWLGL